MYANKLALRISVGMALNVIHLTIALAQFVLISICACKDSNSIANNVNVYLYKLVLTMFVGMDLSLINSTIAVAHYAILRNCAL